LSEFIDTTPWMPRIHTRAEDLAHAGAMIKRGWVQVAEQGGQVTGFCAHDAGEVNALYVAQAARGQGVGSELLEQLQMKQQHLGLWTFLANARAQAFYQRHGFVEMRRTDGADNDEKLPDIWYAWQREAG
jgi:ribosomal protein S18 acetylase RimI-like enzyme